MHIVKPVLPRLSNLIEAVHKNVRSTYVATSILITVKYIVYSSLIALLSTILLTGHRCLHVSWLTVVFSRIFAHDAKNIVKWGVRGFLNMELEGSPLLFPSNWKVCRDPVFLENLLLKVALFS